VPLTKHWKSESQKVIIIIKTEKGLNGTRNEDFLYWLKTVKRNNEASDCFEGIKIEIFYDWYYLRNPILTILNYIKNFYNRDFFNLDAIKALCDLWW
jgi:hypothetical protein